MSLISDDDYLDDWASLYENLLNPLDAGKATNAMMTLSWVYQPAI